MYFIRTEEIKTGNIWYTSTGIDDREHGWIEALMKAVNFLRDEQEHSLVSLYWYDEATLKEVF